MLFGAVRRRKAGAIAKAPVDEVADLARPVGEQAPDEEQAVIGR